MDSDFRWNVLPSRCLRSQHSPGDGGEASGERKAAPLGLAQGILLSPGPTSQWPVAQPTSHTAPWMGKCSGQPALKAEVPPVPTMRTGQGRTRESPSGQLEGPARPQTPRRATPSWAFHTDAVNTTVQKCNKHKAAKQNPDLHWRGMRAPPSRGASCWNRKPPHCSLVGVTTDVF